MNPFNVYGQAALNIVSDKPTGRRKFHFPIGSDGLLMYRFFSALNLLYSAKELW